MQFSKLVPSSEHCRASLVRRRPNGRGLAAHLLGHGHGGLQHVVVGHHAVGEAPLVELLGVEAGRVHEDLAGAGIADDLREEEGAAHVGAGVADGQVAGVHLVGLAEHAHVAGAGDGQAAAHGEALQGADDGLLAAAHVHDLVGAHALHDVEVALDAAHVLGRIEGEVVQVEAGAEGAALAGQHDDAAVLVHAHLDEEVVELGHLGVGHGVQVVRIIEGADVDRTGAARSSASRSRR